MSSHALLGIVSWSDISFGISLKSLLTILVGSVLFYFLQQWRKGFAESCIYFSDVPAFGTGGKKAKLADLPKALVWTSFIAFALAFLDPHFLIDRHSEKSLKDSGASSPVEGIAIYLVLDQSGSMAEEVSAGRRRVISKIDLLKQVTKQFISGDAETGLKGRPNDLIGLIAFARGAHVLSPLTLDHAAVLNELASFAPIGERDQDGTSIGYAIFKTANMIAATKHYAQELVEKGEPAYSIKSTVMILITDGMQDPNPLDKGKRLRNMDIPEATAYAKEQGIRLYIVNVEPKMTTEEFAPYRHIMQRAAGLTGGKFYMVDSTTNLEEIYRDIDNLEKSALPQDQQAQFSKDLRPDLYRRISFYPYLVAIGLLMLFCSFVLESTLFRRIP